MDTIKRLWRGFYKKINVDIVDEIHENLQRTKNTALFINPDDSQQAYDESDSLDQFINKIK